jgi:hypothetical protein
LVKSDNRRTYVDIYVDHMKRKPQANPSPFQSLIAAANIQNAEEFRLPVKVNWGSFQNFGC